jgi:adenylate kinase family enzyme
VSSENRTIVSVANRILVYGVTGSGKTTLAAQIAERTGLPWHPVDDLTWEPGWIEVPPEEQRRRIEAICSGERWILDTAYGKWLDVPMASVELIVALDYPRWFSLSRLIRRSMRRVVTRELACNANVETIGRLLDRDSIVRWHFRSFTRKRARIRSWAEAASGPAVERFTSQRETNRWLASLQRGEERPTRPSTKQDRS